MPKEKSYSATYPLAIDVINYLELNDTEQHLLMVNLNKAVDPLSAITNISCISYIVKYINGDDGLTLIIHLLVNGKLSNEVKFIKNYYGFKPMRLQSSMDQLILI